MSTQPPSRQRSSLVDALTALTLLTLAAPVGAVRFTPVSVEELAARSDTCVVGRVVDEQVGWNDARTLIVTTWTFEVEETLAGEAASQLLRIHRVGGSLEGMTLHYDGMPELRSGERTAVFLHRRAENAWIVSGMRLGVLPEREGEFQRDLADVLGASTTSEGFALPELRRRVRTGAERRAP